MAFKILSLPTKTPVMKIPLSVVELLKSVHWSNDAWFSSKVTSFRLTFLALMAEPEVALLYLKVDDSLT